MNEQEPRPADRDRLPVAPSMAPALEAVHAPAPRPGVTPRVLHVCALAAALGAATALAARGLTHLIAFITNLSFYGRLSIEDVSPAGHALGAWAIAVPVVGALIVGVMARFGSPAIRGHGIPEAMEQVLFNKSRIPMRMTILKPLSAAISIGTGGPFGAEGPIIATGGAVGSMVGQVLHVTADERKVLLAAGAAAGMAATFGSPVSAVLLAVELLLFEYSARSIAPVALAAAVATAARTAIVGGAPAFLVADLPEPPGSAFAAYVLIGAVVGAASVGVTRAVYGLEDAFERLPIHWMWWPALGALVVGAIGLLEPRTLGVGYDNIEDIVSGRLALGVLTALCVLKFLSWSVALASGTSGGTLAPLFTIGGGLGALLGAGAAAAAPALGVDARLAALVGMAAMFAGASRALLASVVFAFETTRQPFGLLPLLGGCAAAYVVSSLLMRQSIMTEKLARRGARVATDLAADFLDGVFVRDWASRPAVCLAAEDPLERVREWLASGAPGSKHQAFPVVNEEGSLVGLVDRTALADPAASDEAKVGDLVSGPARIAYEDNSLREAADHMVLCEVGRLAVVRRGAPREVVGVISRSDLLAAHRGRLEHARLAERVVRPSAREDAGGAATPKRF